MIERQKRLERAVEATDLHEVGRLIAEVVLDTDDAEEIAASFVEDELGRYDWMNNWQVWKRRWRPEEQPLAMVQRYLQRMGYRVNPQEIVNIIDRMAQETPGLWR